MVLNNVERIINPQKMKILLGIGRGSYPIREPAWPVLLETVNSIISWFAAKGIGLYCGQ